MVQRVASARAWRGVRGVRARSTIASVLVVAAALVGGSAVFVVVLQRALVSTVEQAATGRAREVAARIADGGGQGLQPELVRTTREGQIVQVIGAAGQVVATSSARASERPLSSMRPAVDAIQVQSSRAPLLDDDDPYLVVAAGVAAAGSRYTVVVGTPIRAQQESARTALSLLLLGIPLLLLLAGVATWWSVGRALLPVERIRSRVARFGDTRAEPPIDVPDSGDEIARLATTMNDMLSRLAEGQRTQRRFVADASHELRSPLATLAASIEFAAADRSGRTWSQMAPVLVAEVARMGRLVSDLLLLAGVDEHAVTSTWGDVDLDDLLDDELRRLRARPTLSVNADVVPLRVTGDRARMGQVLANLCDNAARHAHSAVTLTSRRDGEDAVVVVQDDGEGIPGPDRERVFGRFVRLDVSRHRSAGGSGLGLAIVLEIVRSHGGTVRVDEAPGGGCRVEVRLPAQPAVP